MRRLFIEKNPDINEYIKKGLRSKFGICTPFDNYFDDIIYNAAGNLGMVIDLARKADEIWYSSEQPPGSTATSIFQMLIPIAVREGWRNKLVINYTVLMVSPLAPAIKRRMNKLAKENNIHLLCFQGGSPCTGDKKNIEKIHANIINPCCIHI